MQRPFRLAQFLAQFGKGAGIIVIALHRAQQFRQFLVSILIQVTGMLQAVFGPLLEFIQGAAAGHPDNGQVETLVTDQTLQRREYFFKGQIAGGAEKDQGIRRLSSHQPPPFLPPVFSRWPPNS